MRTYLSKSLLAVLAAGSLTSVCLAGERGLAATAQQSLSTRLLAFAVPGGFPGGPTKIKPKTDPNFQAPVITVIKKDFAKARGWRIVWKGGSYTSETAKKVPSIFSTVTGAVNSVHYLNNTSWKNTDNADMQLYFGDLRATSKASGLTNKNALKKTSFKLSGMKVADLEDAAVNDPAKFGVIYTLAFDAAGEVKEDYKSGQIYVFKTDRVPAKYGAVRIVSMNPRTIEVVVQK